MNKAIRSFLPPDEVEAIQNEALEIRNRQRLVSSEALCDCIIRLCNEIHGSHAELELLRPIAIAAAEQIAARPQFETSLLEAVEAWQKSNRDSA